MRIHSPSFLFFNGLARVSEFFQKNIFSSRNQKIAVVAAAIFAAIAIGVAVKRYFFKASKSPKKFISEPSGSLSRAASSDFGSLPSSPIEVPVVFSSIVPLAPVAPLLSFEELCAVVDKVAGEQKDKMQACQNEQQQILKSIKTAPGMIAKPCGLTSLLQEAGVRDRKGELNGAGMKLMMREGGKTFGWAERGDFKNGRLVKGYSFAEDESGNIEGSHGVYEEGVLQEGWKCSKGKLVQGTFERGYAKLQTGVIFMRTQVDVNISETDQFDLLYDGEFKNGEITKGKIFAKCATYVIVMEGTFQEGRLIEGTKTTVFADGRTVTEKVGQSTSLRTDS